MGRAVRPGVPYAGKFSVYDAPIYIADAAVVLMATNPELNITHPYALDDTQFQAAIDLLKTQKPAVGEYWGDYTKQISSFQNGNTVIGTTLAGHRQRPAGLRPADAGRGRSSPRKGRPAGRTPG